MTNPKTLQIFSALRRVLHLSSHSLSSLSSASFPDAGSQFQQKALKARCTLPAQRQTADRQSLQLAAEHRG